MASADEIVIREFVSITKTWQNKSYGSSSSTRPELSAAGKNVIVTGGETGIGKAIATAFSQASAASVAILGRREDRLKDSVAVIAAAASNQKTKVLYKVADLTIRADVETAFKDIVKEVGKISILVSNAGTIATTGLVADTNADDFMRGFDMNVRTVLNATQAFIPLAAPNATLINISTGMVHFAPMPGMSSYTATKAATTKMFDYITAENPSLRVFNVQPGVVSTEMNEGTSMEGQDDGMCI